MPEYTREEAAAQMVKAARYFKQVLNGHEGKNLIAEHVEGVTIVIAAGEAADELDAVIAAHLPRARMKYPTEAEIASAVPVAADPKRPVLVLYPLVHDPPPEQQNKPGHVHLHVLSDVKLGRRSRVTGETLCSKKRGSNERTLNSGERPPVCTECSKVAADNGITWEWPK